MEHGLDTGGMKRKRRKIGHDGEAVEEASAPKPRLPTYDFLNLASLILEHDLAILFPGTERPRNAYGLLGAGGSFLVFKEERTMDELTVRPEQIRSLEDSIVLKRTRRYQEGLYDPDIGNDASRYASIMAELQILLDPAVQAHENIIGLQGLTWDFELDEDGSYSVWPVIGLEAAEFSLQSLMYEYDESDAPLSTRLQYCLNVAAALTFLHERGVAHCDVKLENVLVCVTRRSGSVAKLGDFGSALLAVNENTFVPRGVAGTPPWNAPEYRKALRGLNIFKVDVFSYGMLVWRFLSSSPTLQRLDNGSNKERQDLMQKLEELKQTDGLARLAVEEVKDRYDPSEQLDCVMAILAKTLAPLPQDRCGMTEVLSLLAPWVDISDDYGGNAEYAPDIQGEIEEGSSKNAHVPEIESDEDMQPILPIQPEPFYNDVSLPKSLFVLLPIPIVREVLRSI
jgi:serine/threonine protein kinase